MKIRLFIVALTACASFSFMQAQTLAKPAEPNETCMEAWNNSRKADALWKTGWGLFGAGAGMTVAGCVAWSLTNYQWNKSHDNTWTNPGFSIMCIGGGTFFASIPCLAIGQVRRKSAMQIYDTNRCSPETCEDIRISYEKANNLWKTGWGLFTSGIVATALFGTFGYIYSFSGASPSERTWRDSAPSISCWTLCYISAGAIAASVPCLAIGQVRRKAAQTTMNVWECPSGLTCEQIQLRRKQDEDLWKAGWGLFGGGLGLACVGFSTVFTAYWAPNIDSHVGRNLELAGWAFVGIGGVATIASIPCLSFGQVQRRASTRLYQEQNCAQQPVLTFSLQSSANGLGIAMNF